MRRMKGARKKEDTGNSRTVHKCIVHLIGHCYIVLSPIKVVEHQRLTPLSEDMKLKSNHPGEVDGG